MLFHLVKTDPKNIFSVASSSANTTIDKLQNLPQSSWNVAITIVNLQLQSSLELGNVIFADKASDTFKNMIKKLEKGAQTYNSQQKERSNYLIDTIKGTYDKNVMALVKVDASDVEQAIDKGIQQIELAVNILQFYGRASMSNDIISYRMYMGREGHIFQSQSSVLALSQIDDVQKMQGKFHYHKTGYLFPYLLDQRAMEVMDSLSLHRTCEILSESDEMRTPLERLLITALTFYGLSINEYDQRSSFINFIICLESLLLKEKEPQKGLLAERVALIIGENEIQRVLIFNKMEKLYQLRSDYVHRGGDNITHAEVSLISFYAFNVIIKLITHSEKITDIGMLIEKFKSLKFSGLSFESVLKP